jgi:undecaprenyl diphosphate synthase
MGEQPLRHVAIIPDGNRRWARAKGMLATAGHAAAITHDRLLGFIKEAKRLGIPYLSIWGFSTENWKREKVEVEGLFSLLRKAIKDMRKDAHEHQVRFRWLGRRDRLPQGLREELEGFERETAQYGALHFQLCLDYGGRDELLRAVNSAVAAGTSVDERAFAALLDTHGIPDPDLIIRTSGEQRLSGLFPWQGVYAELLFVEKHFPDFGPQDLAAAADEFARRTRRFGGS